LKGELPVTDTFRAGEEFETSDEERADPRGGQVEDTNLERFVWNGDGGPRTRETEFEFATFLGAMSGYGLGEDFLEFGFIQESGLAGNLDLMDAGPVSGGEFGKLFADQFVDLLTGEDENLPRTRCGGESRVGEVLEIGG
jgi:hypothetical protein